MCPRRLCRALFLVPGLLLTGAATAGCSRPIQVPAAVSGQTVTTSGQQVGGVIPEVMNKIGQRIGCTFVWTPVARMRLEAKFENGEADMLIASNQVPHRDLFGYFIPMMETRATLISVRSERAPVHSMQELRARRELRVALVRGYDFGPAYQALSADLAAQGRLYLQPQPTTVARMLAEGLADVTIMTGIAFVGGLYGDARSEIIAGKLRSEPLDDLPWLRGGIYLSKKSLNAADRQLLEHALNEAVRDGTWWRALQRYYDPSVLNDSTRPLPRAR